MDPVTASTTAPASTSATHVLVDRATLDRYVTDFTTAARSVIAAGDQAIKSKAAADAAVMQSVADDAASAAAHDVLDKVVDGIEEFQQAGYASPSAGFVATGTAPAATGAAPPAGDAPAAGSIAGPVSNN